MDGSADVTESGATYGTLRILVENPKKLKPRCMSADLCDFTDYNPSYFLLYLALKHAGYKFEHVTSNGTNWQHLFAIGWADITPIMYVQRESRISAIGFYLTVFPLYYRGGFAMNQNDLVTSAVSKWYEVFNPLAWAALMGSYIVEILMARKARNQQSVINLLTLILILRGYLTVLFGNFILDSMLARRVPPFWSLNYPPREVELGEFTVATRGISILLGHVSQPQEWEKMSLENFVKQTDHALTLVNENRKYVCADHSTQFVMIQIRRLNLHNVISVEQEHALAKGFLTLVNKKLHWKVKETITRSMIWLSEQGFAERVVNQLTSVKRVYTLKKGQSYPVAGETPPMQMGHFMTIAWLLLFPLVIGFAMEAVSIFCGMHQTAGFLASGDTIDLVVT